MPKGLSSIPDRFLESLVEVFGLAMSLLSRLFLSSGSFVLALMRSGYATGLGLASDLKALVLAAWGGIAKATGLDEVLGIIANMDPVGVLFVQFISLGSCLAILGMLAYGRHSTLERGRYRIATVGLLWVIAFASIGVAILGFPPRYVVGEVSSLSGLDGKNMAVGPVGSRLSIIVPRHSEIVTAKLGLASQIELGTSLLINISVRDPDQGVAVTSKEYAAFGFSSNSSLALKGFSCLVSAVERPTQPLVLYGYSGTEGPSGDPLFRATALTQGMGFDPEWVPFQLQDPYLLLANTQLWLVLTTTGEDAYIWWISGEEEDRGSVLAWSTRDRWQRISGDLCFMAMRSPEYSNEIAVTAGRVSDYWQGVVPTGSTVTIDLADPLSDYVDLSPENFKEVSVPLYVASRNGAEILIASLELIVRESNPQISYGIVSSLLALLVGSVCVYGVIRLQRPSSASEFAAPSPESHMPLSTWKPIE